MIRFFTVLLVLSSAFYAYSQQVDSLNSPQVWLRADKSQLQSNKWTDMGVYKNDALAATANELPSPGQMLNFNKTIFFDGADDYLKIPFNLERPAELSILAVFQSADTAERGIWGIEQAAARKILLTTQCAIGPDTIIDRYGKNENVTVLNSVLQTWDKPLLASVPSSAYTAFGSAGKSTSYKPFKGSFAELIVFNHALSFLERIQYETYLAIKYGTGLSKGNFVSSNEKVLWDAEKNANYGNHIAGIGRDDFFALNQKQSGSAQDSSLVIMSVGQLARSNDENNALLPNHHFLVWGDNAGSLSANRGTGADSVLAIVQRKWLVTSTGMMTAKLATELYIDITRFPSNALGYWLALDRSGKGNFSVDNLEYIEADRIENGKAVYKVVWDNDGSGMDCFGFAQARSLFAVARKLNNPSCTNETAGRIKVEVVAGEAPFRCVLANAEGKIFREWRQSDAPVEQKDLIEGTYTLLVMDAREKIERTFSLIKPDALRINLGPDQRLSTDKEIVLDVSSQIPDSIRVSYRWENNFGFESPDRKITATEAGIYHVFVTKLADGCVFTDDVSISGGDRNRVAVYPNIMQVGENYSTSISLVSLGSVNVKVFNSGGSVIHDLSGSGQTEYQFIATLRDPGMFLVLIHTPQGIETRKVVVY